MIKLGNINAQKVMLGTTSVQKVMLGTQQVWALAPPYLNVTPTSQSLPNTVGSFTIQIESNVAWTIENTNSWLSVSVVSGVGNATITVTFSANTASQRTANIVVRAEMITKTIGVTQVTAINDISVDPISVRVLRQGGLASINVVSSYNWTATSRAFWITKISPASGSSGRTRVTLTIAPNNDTTERLGYVSFISTGEGSADFLVTQGAMTASGAESILSADSSGIEASKEPPTLDIQSAEVPTNQDQTSTMESRD